MSSAAHAGRRKYAVNVKVNMEIEAGSPEMAKALARAWLRSCPNEAVVNSRPTSVKEID